ncbi:hypothetical protein ACHAQF_003473 [Verticillium nonalfalfae]
MTLRRALVKFSIANFPGSGFTDLIRFLCPGDEIASSDMAWNMLTMAPTQHRDWSRVRFGLKFVDNSVKPLDTNAARGDGASRTGQKKKATEEAPETPKAKAAKQPEARVSTRLSRETGSAEGPNTEGSDTSEWSSYSVELHWMPRRMVEELAKHTTDSSEGLCYNKMKLDSEEEKELVTATLSDIFTNKDLTGHEPTGKDSPGTDDTSPKETKPIMWDSSGRPVESGHVFTFRAATADMKKTEAMIRSQWLMIKLAALSAAAESVNILDRRPPFGPISPIWQRNSQGEFVVLPPPPVQTTPQPEAQETKKEEES